MTANTVATKETSTKINLSVAKVLQGIVKRKLSGKLTIRDSTANSIIWQVYVGNGLLHFATSITGQQERLFYLLQRYHPEFTFLQSSKIQSEYQHLCHFWQSGHLSLQQLRQLLFTITQEALLQLLTLPQAQFEFEKVVGLDPLILSVSFKQTLEPVRTLVQHMLRLQPDIVSPFQRFFVKDMEQLTHAFKLAPEKPGRLTSLIQALTQYLCLYELAYQLKRDSFELATFLLPLVRNGAIGTTSYHNVQNEKRPIVACIDDSKAVQRQVKLILEATGYRVLEIMEPTRTLTTLVRNKPVLILMDISMPEIDGYELCRMLRQSSALQEIPIVMLTGKDGLIDRLRARMVGATDYITKPFNPQKLLDIVQKSIILG